MTLLPGTERALTEAIARDISKPVSDRRFQRLRRRSTAAATGIAAAVSISAVAVAAVIVSDRPEAPQATRNLPVLGSARTTSLADLRGHTVLLTFYASWCTPCLEQAKIVAKIGDQMRADGTGTAVLVSYKDTPARALRFTADNDLDIPVLGDPDGAFASAYHLSGIPEVLVLDPLGRIAATRKGFTDEATLRADLAQAASPAASQPPASTSPPATSTAAPATTQSP